MVLLFIHVYCRYIFADISYLCVIFSRVFHFICCLTHYCQSCGWSEYCFSRVFPSVCQTVHPHKTTWQAYSGLWGSAGLTQAYLRQLFQRGFLASKVGQTDLIIDAQSGSLRSRDDHWLVQWSCSTNERQTSVASLFVCVSVLCFVLCAFPVCYCLVVSTSAINCLERLVSEMPRYVLSGKLNPIHTHSLTPTVSANAFRPISWNFLFLRLTVDII